MLPYREDNSQESYFLLQDPNLNLKLRYGMLDLKQRLAVDPSGFEQWFPIFKAVLPLIQQECAELCDLLPGKLGLTGESDLLLQLEGHPEICVVNLNKQRKRYLLGEVQAEYTIIQHQDREVVTIALEHLDRQLLEQVRRDYQLPQLVNESYPQALKRLLGSSGRES